MAIDKSRTSLGVKVMLVVVAVAMVGYLVPTLFGLFGSGGPGNNAANQSSQDAMAQIAQKYTGVVAAADAALRSDPTSYTVLVNLANTYFDWAFDVLQAGGDNQALRGADQPMWLAARQFYDRATTVKAGEPNVAVDMSIAYFYSGETTKAVAIATTVTKTDPAFAPAWFNLGIFHGASGNAAAAIASFEKAIQLDPKGQQINLQYAQQQLASLKGSSGASTTTTSP